MSDDFKTIITLLTDIRGLIKSTNRLEFLRRNRERRERKELKQQLEACKSAQ